jgi:hypothetical protein
MQKWALPCTLGKAKRNPGSAGLWPASCSAENYRLVHQHFILPTSACVPHPPQAQGSGK